MSDNVYAADYFEFKKLNNEGRLHILNYKEKAEELLNDIHKHHLSRDFSFAITKLEESVMWFSKAISNIKEFQEKE